MAELRQTRSFLISKLETAFLRWGKFVSFYPYQVILTSIIFTALCSLGLTKFRIEQKANLLWIPPESEFNINKDWLEKNFEKDTRDELVLFESENVLTPESLKYIFQVHKAVNDAEIDGKTFSNICDKVPIADIFQTKRRKKRQVPNETEEYEEYDFWEGEYNEYTEEDERKTTLERINFKKYSSQQNRSDEEDTWEKIPASIYCDLITTLNDKCVQSSILEIWKYKEELINSATQQEILDAVNLLVRSPWFGSDEDYAGHLGGIDRNSSGHIVGAKSMRMAWVIKVPKEGRVVSSDGSGVELGVVDETSLAWEAKLIDIALNSSTENMKITLNAGRSYGDVSAEAVFTDRPLLAGGYLIMFIYTIVMLGRLNTLEIRLYLAVSGLVSIGMGIVLAIGISSLLGFPYTPIHNLLPFLCLGIGIDDMFVIIQCWSNMKKDVLNAGLSLPDQMGIALKHAGVSVTVTTLTDVFAFGVGAVTQMPGLASFCVCTAICLSSIYLLQISWFVAWMSLDERRKASGHDGILPCIVHGQFILSDGSQTKCGNAIVKMYARLLSSVIFKCLVILITVGLLVVGVWGFILIETKMDFAALIPSDSYLQKFHSLSKNLYPNKGWPTEIYTAEFDDTDLQKFEELTNQLNELKMSKTYLLDVDSWWSKLIKYSEEKANFTTWQDFANPAEFPVILSDFLFSSQGSRFKPNFMFDGDLLCNQAAPPIKASKFTIEYILFKGPEEHIPARRKIEEIVKNSDISGAFSFVKEYALWETDEIIGLEIWRNVGLAMGCVFIVTLILLANFSVCLMVFTIVIITFVDIVGFLHFWDITIDVISCINLVLSIGLCVDYSVHIGHAFLVAKGSRQEKAVEAVATIGPAVFNGGMTTFLALVLIGASTSHVFVTFFKVFVLTVLFGLFHGLVLFPVILSLVGPLDRSSSTDSIPAKTDSVPAKTDSVPAETGQHTNQGYVLDVLGVVDGLGDKIK